MGAHTGDLDKARKLLEKEGPQFPQQISALTNHPFISMLLTRADDILFIGPRKKGVWCLDYQTEWAQQILENERQKFINKLIPTQDKWNNGNIYKLSSAIAVSLFSGKSTSGEIAEFLDIPKLNSGQAKNIYGVYYTTYSRLLEQLKGWVERDLIQRHKIGDEYHYRLKDDNLLPFLRVPLSMAVDLYRFSRNGTSSEKTLRELAEISNHSIETFRNYFEYNRPEKERVQYIQTAVVLHLLRITQDSLNLSQIQKVLRKYQYDPFHSYNIGDIFYFAPRHTLATVLETKDGYEDTDTEYCGKLNALLLDRSKEVKPLFYEGNTIRSRNGETVPWSISIPHLAEQTIQPIY